ncbi:MAG: hypothetical protein IRY95_00820, partial [Clostridia bacterium]|nr:hypothetical protein [Clostridia bacterium]
VEGLAEDAFQVAVSPAPGRRCARCWNYREDVGDDRRHPDVCGRCAAVLVLLGA